MEQADPRRIRTLADLAHEFDRLRRLAAGRGQLQVSVRQIATRTRKAPSTLDPYLRGERLCPADTYEEILRALGVPNDQLRPWLDAWERLADARSPGGGRRPQPQASTASRHARPLSYTELIRYGVAGTTGPTRAVGIVTGDIRRVHSAEVWVNSENTNMDMARFEDFSISAIIRFEGALRDEAGRVIDDQVATALAGTTAGRVPVAPGTAIVTGSGQLARTNGVRFVVHVAAVHGEPGEGYRQVRDVGRCVTNALTATDGIDSPGEPVRSILFPLLGTGVAGGDLVQTVERLLGAAVDYLTTQAATAIEAVDFLAYTDEELAVCMEVFGRHPRLIE
jgi:O-acetyl-ADP-ribose deacetylase (regulator of RNase III)